MEIVWRVSGRCLAGVWKVYFGCLEGVLRVSGRNLWDVCMVFSLQADFVSPEHVDEKGNILPTFCNLLK